MQLLCEESLAYNESDFGNVSYNARPLYIGAIETLGENVFSAFKGNIDEVRIWGKALSESEINSNKDNQLTGNENGLLGYWNFNEGEGSIVKDKTHYGINGTINSASWERND